MSKGIVLLHGAGLGGWIWDAVQPHLGERVIAIDLHGPGGIDRREATLARCADHVLEQVQGWSEVVVVGHSVSGALALEVASRLGERAVEVILVGAVVPPSAVAR